MRKIDFILLVSFRLTFTDVGPSVVLVNIHFYSSFRWGAGCSWEQEPSPSTPWATLEEEEEEEEEGEVVEGASVGWLTNAAGWLTRVVAWPASSATLTTRMSVRMSMKLAASQTSSRSVWTWCCPTVGL